MLTASAVTHPIGDFAVLYRMSTGVFGQKAYRKDRPFPYARPYISRLSFGSSLALEVVVPTLILGSGAAKLGLPKLLDLVEQAMLMPSSFAAKREKNREDRDQSRLIRIGIEEQLAHPEDVKRRAYARQRADIAAAEAHELRSIAEARELLDRMDPELVDSVRELYGRSGIRNLGDVARRAENGPARPEGVQAYPVEHPQRYPDPPRDLRMTDGAFGLRGVARTVSRRVRACRPVIYSPADAFRGA